ncbi:MAG TPA: hypothetical protein VD788_03765 [Candidatus Polarisedimenticolaceae bacterium]|nr:hypothetical protein [Candidatus Polarisedimenticolaceae bacterium]
MACGPDHRTQPTLGAIGPPALHEPVTETGFYTWPSTNHLVQDVRLSIATPRRNFGWVLIGDEVTPLAVKRFASREHPDE